MANTSFYALTLYQGGYRELEPAHHHDASSAAGVNTAYWLSEAGRDIDEDARSLLGRFNRLMREQGLWLNLLGLCCVAQGILFYFIFY